MVIFVVMYICVGFVFNSFVRLVVVIEYVILILFWQLILVLEIDVFIL